MTLARYIDPDTRNKFCIYRSLYTESDVEQFFIMPLLKHLGFSTDFIRTKKTISEEIIGKGVKKKNYAPDYICYLDKAHKRPILVIDAKTPSKDARRGITDAQMYASIIRRSLEEPKPDQYCLGINGTQIIVKHYDSNITLNDIWFDEVEDSNPKYQGLKNRISFNILKQSTKAALPDYKFKKPPTNEALKSLFEACHKLIWKTEKRSPSSAFYEFTKIMYIKLVEDMKLRENLEVNKKIEAGEPIPKDSVIFSIHWIERQEQRDPNPINSILFKNLRKELENQIAEKKKKRIFDKDEEIDLNPSTIKETVRLLQHHDLYAVDEDLNGKLFETFLNATMRGKELGQFFTPRSVVLFMTEMADFKVGKKHIDRVLDACCGTGGFLIEAMAIMAKKVEDNDFLTNKEKEELIKQIKNECLWGIDAGKSPPIARIARINMLLHKDGGSRIYFADSLDKDLLIEEGLDNELKRDRQELKEKLNKECIKFNVVLTNPPFSMKYEKKKQSERRILEKYEIAYKINKKNERELRTSLRSAVMFLERYYDLLVEKGRLITIMDESILNTATNKPFREYIKEKFIIKAVISLPTNTFVNTGSAVKTSVLYLRKKKTSDESQPKVFMAISSNVGHNDTGKDTPDQNDLPKILEAFQRFEQEAG